MQTLPFLLEASVGQGASGGRARMDIEVPTTGALAGAELTHIELCDAQGRRLRGEAAVFLQQLDGQGRACSHPFALFAQSTSQASCDGRVKIPLQNGQKVRVFLFVTEGSVPAVVRFSGAFFPAQGVSCTGNPTVAAKVARFVEGPWVFVPDMGRRPPQQRGCKRARSAEMAASESRSEESEPPRLIHAQVTGGDDES